MTDTNNRIGKDFSLLSLAYFGLPAFLMNTFTQLFRSLDDGLFISRYVGESALGSVNLINPISGIQFALACLFSVGASNISARLMGQNKQQEAKQVFTRVAISGCIAGAIFGLLVNFFDIPILRALGADESNLEFAITQVRIIYILSPLMIFNQIASSYFSTAGKPKMGLICSITSGVINISLDVVLVAILKMGVVGAAIATAAGEIAVFLISFLFFINKKQEIHFVQPAGHIIETSIEAAEFSLPQSINSISFALTAWLSNIVIIQYIGQVGVSANAIVQDIRKILTAGLIGFATCICPILSYNYGSKNVKRLKKILKYLVCLGVAVSIILVVIGLLLRVPLINIFMNENSSQQYYDLTYLALTIELFEVGFIAGCITISRSLIALSLPKEATVVSIFRNIIIKVIVYIGLPYIMGDLGIWYSQPVSEGIAFIFGVIIVINVLPKTIKKLEQDDEISENKNAYIE